MKGLLARAVKNAPAEGSEADAAALSKLAKKQNLLAVTKTVKKIADVSAVLEEPALPSKSDLGKWWPEPVRETLNPLVPFPPPRTAPKTGAPLSPASGTLFSPVGGVRGSSGFGGRSASPPQVLRVGTSGGMGTAAMPAAPSPLGSFNRSVGICIDCGLLEFGAVPRTWASSPGTAEVFSLRRRARGPAPPLWTICRIPLTAVRGPLAREALLD